jgi:hypothetical protein
MLIILVLRECYKPVIPITQESLVSEWMHDWNNPKSGKLVEKVYSKYGAMIGLK